MSYQITYWEDPPNKQEPEHYHGIESIRIKSVDEIPILLLNRPKRCTLITLERTSRYHTKRDGTKTDKYMIRALWEKNNPAVQEYRKYISKL